ncbi:hypothetical protein BVRB_4g074200 [Beta vulgaris subsp. vulgaris]|nr:hypothetical protein BVRB_4g074200 [Beta vulgaris subsp. vulgaris]
MKSSSGEIRKIKEGAEAGLSGKAKFIRTRLDTEYPQEKFHEVLSSLKGQQENSFDSKEGRLS